jgi:hypothetical protein
MIEQQGGTDSLRQQLEDEIAQIRRNARCVQRAAALMAFLTTLAVAGLGYPSILLENFPYSAPPFLMHLIYALGVGSLVSFMVFAGLGTVYRKKLDRRKEKCPPLASRPFESSLGQPDCAPLPFMPLSRHADGNEGTDRGSVQT